MSKQLQDHAAVVALMFRGENYRTDKNLGSTPQRNLDSPATKFVALEDFRRKVIVCEPKDCEDRNEARAAVLDQVSNLMFLAASC